MKIKLNIKKRVKKENNEICENNENKKVRSANTKEYKIDTQNITVKKTAVRERKGYVSGKKDVREGRVIKYVRSFFKNEKKLPKSYYCLLIAMILLAITTGVLVIKNYRFTDLEDYITYSLDEEVVSASSSIDSGEVDENVEAVLEEVVVENVVVKQEEKKEEEKLVFSSPMNGEISKIYSPDKLVYSKTLELWKTHDGIDIEGEIGQNVFAIEKGKVSKVYEDSFFGYTVVLEHIQGYSSAYSNLSEDIPVSVGEIVAKGEIIGQISNSSVGEIKDLPHLHFTLMKDGNTIDPTYITKN